MKHFTPILLLVALFLAACQPVVLLPASAEAAQDAPALEEQIAEVRAASAAWDEAFNAGDLSQLLALYTDDAVDMPPGLPALEGIDAVAGDLQYVLDTFDAHHETSIVDIKIDGDIALERAGYTMELIPEGRRRYHQRSRQTRCRATEGRRRLEGAVGDLEFRWGVMRQASHLKGENR